MLCGGMSATTDVVYPNAHVNFGIGEEKGQQLARVVLPGVMGISASAANIGGVISSCSRGGNHHPQEGECLGISRIFTDRTVGN